MVITPTSFPSTLLSIVKSQLARAEGKSKTVPSCTRMRYDSQFMSTMITASQPRVVLQPTSTLLIVQLCTLWILVRHFVFSSKKRARRYHTLQHSQTELGPVRYISSRRAVVVVLRGMTSCLANGWYICCFIMHLAEVDKKRSQYRKSWKMQIESVEYSSGTYNSFYL